MHAWKDVVPLGSPWIPLAERLASGGIAGEGECSISWIYIS